MKGQCGAYLPPHNCGPHTDHLYKYIDRDKLVDDFRTFDKKTNDFCTTINVLYFLLNHGYIRMFSDPKLTKKYSSVV